MFIILCLINDKEKKREFLDFFYSPKSCLNTGNALGYMSKNRSIIVFIDISFLGIDTLSGSDHGLSSSLVFFALTFIFPVYSDSNVCEILASTPDP